MCNHESMRTIGDRLFCKICKQELPLAFLYGESNPPEETPVEETPIVEEITEGTDAPSKETPVEEIPVVEEITAEDVPIEEETPVEEETPIEEKPKATRARKPRQPKEKEGK